MKTAEIVLMMILLPFSEMRGGNHQATVKEIRKIDLHKTIVIEPAAWATPSSLNGFVPFDRKEQIKESLQDVRKFANDYGVSIYIGEFGSIRWAPENSTYRYLKDLIEILEEEGWDWAYHAFREWNGWSVEHSTDKNDNSRVSKPTDRELLLRYWFAKNQRFIK